MSSIFTHCIACQSDKIRKVQGSFSVTIQDKTLKIPHIEYYECSQCGEKFMDLDNESKIDAYLKRKSVHVA
jgi:YgiT-type zinc finger domain-containing protein